jgi:hypothetical protein
VDFYVSRLSLLGPYLPLLRPHVPLLLQHGRLPLLTPHVPALLTASGGAPLVVAANVDLLLFWLGWALRVPLLPRLFFALPWAPGIVAWLVRVLPRRGARRCGGVECVVDGDYGPGWNELGGERGRNARLLGMNGMRWLLGRRGGG